MVTKFFDDYIFRKEDVLEEFEFVPGDYVSLDFKFTAKEHVHVFVVRGEKLVEKGE